MGTPEVTPPADDTVIQASVGLADTPMGQRLAITITALLGKDGAAQLGEAIVKVAAAMSSSGLVVAGTGTVPVNGHANGAGALGAQPDRQGARGP